MRFVSQLLTRELQKDDTTNIHALLLPLSSSRVLLLHRQTRATCKELPADSREIPDRIDGDVPGVQDGGRGTHVRSQGAVRS